MRLCLGTLYPVNRKEVIVLKYNIAMDQARAKGSSNAGANMLHGPQDCVVICIQFSIRPGRIIMSSAMLTWLAASPP